MNSDFKELLSLFNQYGIRYLVVGGYAVMLYTEPRFTKDIDIAIGCNEESAQKVRAALEEFGFPMAEEAAKELSKENRMISIGRPPSRIDILNKIDGVDFDSAWIQRETRRIDQVEISFINKEFLKKSKLATGRPQDLIDLKNLESTK